MKKFILPTTFILIIIVIIIIIKLPQKQPTQPAANQNNAGSQTAVSDNPPTANSESSPANAPQNNNVFSFPLDRAGERVTKKPFGIFITPQTSPVQPERFRGYHTGADFEIFSEELNNDVPVAAICQGKLILKEYASGYGGVAAESCTLDGSPITVIYGHLKLASITKNSGQSLAAGEKIGILGAAYSSETNGERKHLHLGIHKGVAVSILGYVQSQSALSDWIDPCLFVCHN